MFTHEVVLPQPIMRMSYLERANVITHLVACVVLVIYMLLRQIWGLSGSQQLDAFQAVWIVHFASATLAALTFLWSSVYHANPRSEWWAVRLFRTIDIGMVTFTIAIALFANTAVGLLAFWSHLIVESSEIATLSCQPSVYNFIRFNWRTLFDSVAAGVFALAFTMIALNSVHLDQALFVFGKHHSTDRNTRRWGFGDHHFSYYRVSSIIILLLGWIVVAPLDIAYIPAQFGTIVIGLRVAGTFTVVLTGIADAYEYIDHLASTATCSTCSHMFPFSHTVWHVATFAVVIMDIILRDHTIELIVSSYLSKVNVKHIDYCNVY